MSLIQTDGRSACIDADLADIGATQSPPTGTARAIWIDASFWVGGHSWAWIDDLGNFAHGRSRGWAVDSNDAELWAIAEGLRATAPSQLVHVNTDSAIAAALLRPFAEVRDSTMEPPPDVRRFRESRDEVARLCCDRTVVIHHVRAHSTDQRNRAADKLATAARRHEASTGFWSHAWREAVRGIEPTAVGGPAICSCGLLG